MTSPQGRFVWYELVTPDPAAAERFYCDVIGWRAKDAGVPDMSYTLFSVGEAQVAGAMALPANAPRPGWIGYVAVADVDASTAAVERAGGAVHRPPTDIPGVGRFAIVADPQGAVLALFCGAGEMEWQPAPMGAPGHGGWHELMAADWQAAFDFYAGLFGWTKAEPFDIGEMGIYQLFAAGGETIGGMMTKSESVPAPFWLYYFNVEAIDPAKSRIEAAGGRIVNGPMEVPGGSWIVHGFDPQGAFFALVAPKR